MITPLCARNCHSICKLDGTVCREPCAQFVSFDEDLYSNLTSHMNAQEKKSSKKPKSTFYEILRGSQSSAALQQGVNCNRDNTQRLLENMKKE